MPLTFKLEITESDSVKDSKDLAKYLHRIARKVDIEGIAFKAKGGGYIFDDYENVVGTFTYE